ncbi:MAG TPA: HAMP domain-containing sensor histidine kinase [Vicinamibacterales bacterium]|nr:HAMP domain-containing sensor histidine kinase [Vicinamibacterales bacterium]
MIHDVKTRISPVTILVAIVVLLVPALAWMQYQWLGQLSEAERERMQRTLRTAAAQFATDFDTELSRTLIDLQVDGATLRDQNWRTYAQNYSRWAAGTPDPRLVRDVWLVDALPGTQLPEFGGDRQVPPDRLRIRRWNAQSMAFEDAEWPEDLARLRDTLAARFIGLQMQRGRGEIAAHRDATISVTLGDDATLISPVTYVEFPDDHRGPPKIAILGFTIVRLDPAVLRETLLTTLAARHFSTHDDANYRVAVMRRDDSSNVVWESEPGAARLVAVKPDVTQPFMGPRPEQMFVYARGMRGGIPPPPPPPPDATSRLPGSRAAGIPTADNKVVISMVEREDRVNGGRIVTRAGGLGLEGRWLLLAQHRAGSLEAAVARVRMRNLWISSGVLLLLTLAVGLIVVSARRAQSLARQQMEFVAAVSHELRTPVSVIGAAAGNLADGVVGDPQRVRKYGETIQGEARRLAETVERVLQLAGIAAGRAAASRAVIDPAALVHEAIAECRTEIDAAGVEVEVAIADDLPNVAGDVSALKSALRNLISNAVKYGGSARWLRVSVSVPAPGTLTIPTAVSFAVDDRGLGIDAEDRKHIFEPFYRGREAVSQQIQGSGLGLNLVLRIAEAHGGRVSVTSEPGKGSTFTLALPAANDRASTESQLHLVREAPSPR